jgi:hypothetical protein
MLDTYPDVRTRAFALRVEADCRTGIERALVPGARMASDGKLMCASTKPTDSQPVASNYDPTVRGSPGTQNRGVNPVESDNYKWDPTREGIEQH